VQSINLSAVTQFCRANLIFVRNEPADVVWAVTASVREALAANLNGARVHVPGAMWLVSSAPA
jgi:hypothetical protein